jgi:hypothetical protein
VHLEGYNLLPYLTGAEQKSPCKEFFYFSDDGDLTGLRYDNWKFVFAEQRVPGTLQVSAEPFTQLRVPLVYNLRLDPYERANITSNTYYDWLLDHAFMLAAAQAYVGRFLATFKEYLPRQNAASFSIGSAASISGLRGQGAICGPSWRDNAGIGRFVLKVRCEIVTKVYQMGMTNLSYSPNFAIVM